MPSFAHTHSFNHYQRTGDDEEFHESRYGESEGSVYDYQEEQDWGDDEGEDDEGSLLDVEEGLSDRAYGSDEDGDPGDRFIYKLILMSN
jgi:hypothetical protein